MACNPTIAAHAHPEESGADNPGPARAKVLLQTPEMEPVYE